jgi:hypothetical protein
MRASFCMEVIEAESRRREMIMTRTPSGAAIRAVARQPSSVEITVSMFSRSRFSSFVWSLGSQVKTLTRVEAEGSKTIVHLYCPRVVPKRPPYREDEWTSLNESQSSKTFFGTVPQVSLGRQLHRSTYRPSSWSTLKQVGSGLFFQAFQSESTGNLRGLKCCRTVFSRSREAMWATRLVATGSLRKLSSFVR